MLPRPSVCTSVQHDEVVAWADINFLYRMQTGPLIEANRIRRRKQLEDEKLRRKQLDEQLDAQLNALDA